MIRKVPTLDVRTGTVAINTPASLQKQNEEGGGQRAEGRSHFQKLQETTCWSHWLVSPVGIQRQDAKAQSDFNRRWLAGEGRLG